MIVDEDAYLEHFGVRGMRWGVRRQNRNTSGSEKKGLSRNKKIAIGVGVAAGATAVGLILRQRNIKVKDLRVREETFIEAKRLISLHGETRMNNINRASFSGKITKEQGNRMRNLAYRQMTSAIKRAAEQQKQPTPKFPNAFLYKN